MRLRNLNVSAITGVASHRIIAILALLFWLAVIVVLAWFWYRSMLVGFDVRTLTAPAILRSEINAN